MPPNDSNHTEIALLIDRVSRMMRILEGNGAPGLVQRQSDTERRLAEVASRQHDCPARRRNWLNVVLCVCAIAAAAAALAPLFLATR